MTLEELTKILQYAATAYDRELTEDMVAVYFDQLGRYDWRTVAEAVRRHVSKVEWFPTVANIRQQMATIARLKPDPAIQRNNEIHRRVTDARRSGCSVEEIEALITRLENQMIVRDE